MKEEDMGELCHNKACEMDAIKIVHYVFGGFFNPEDYEKYLVEIPGTKDYTPQLKKDEIGIVVYPTNFTRSNLDKEVSPCDKRQVGLSILCW